ncbi:amino acid/amide ABC transporter ATP-binding protein 2, HAAT family [Gemmobacter megaterium]|uniref:Amino acid/amide ABC transporter ATP-binding protein 2, HAAT family n=1 Tax=Gemmobacter megaterium TaxID=1086013 RepID=A0A1N7LNI3_9RHOB|nr:ABC transporter ATP-binding protein [Gemmobacter megaterium]GGE11548.1 ABC transporter ATP-binding protein [Gemmobacter megaterium]SIS75349.1 amino acid/amide ABC transporter ATP-binding protein 2, HAAT family [Gemmobacter megaterium]
MLEVSGLSVSYGRHLALESAALTVAAGEIVVVLGSNGAGKSTLIKALSGLVAPHPGARVTLDGTALHKLPAHRIVEAGLALVPEGRHLFSTLSVAENLALGAFMPRTRAQAEASLERVFEVFPKLKQRLGQIAGTMSGGEQQMVAIGRAMMTCPKLLLLDEPSLGLSPLLTAELFRALPRIAATGAGVLLVEQNSHHSLAISDRGYLLEKGVITGQGAAADLLKSEEVQKAYLGM